MAQITAKTSKKGLIDFIIETAASIVDENLRSRVNYTLKALQKDESKVSKTDLYELAKEILSLPAPTPTKAPVENSPKPKLNGKKKTSEAKGEAPKAETKTEDEAPAETPKETKNAPKKPVKVATKEAPKPKVETTDNLVKGTLPLAKIFPKEIQHPALGKLVACPEKYSTVDEIRKALDEEDKTLVFAAYWTKRHIKQMGYAQMFNVPVPKEFPFDLDTLQVLYVCDGIDRIYALSSYTEAMFEFMAEDLVRTEVEGNDGSKFFMRYSAGMEYEIYEAVDVKKETDKKAK